ncbi:MAG: hypothetical protein ABI591_02775 [Kofleriaceae bacterium]
MADDAGALLVRSGLVTSSALDGARARVTEVGGTIGEQLVATGIVSDEALTDFYKSRLLVPQVNPNTLARLSNTIIGVIPNDMAIELRVVPVSLDPENNLTVAMSDPSDRHAVDEIAFFTGAYVVRAVATQMQIAWCLAHYYGHVTNLGQRLLRPEGGNGGNGEAKPEPAAAAHTRTRGITGEVNAMRHHGIVPGEAQFDQPSVIVEAPVPIVDEGSGQQRAVSGEIRMRRAPSIRPPFPEDSGPVITMEAEDSTSGPSITIEAGEPDDTDDLPVAEALAALEAGEAAERDDDTDRAKPVPRRKRPAEPDPPELAARAGEIGLKGEADREIGSGPSIVIDEALDSEGVPEHVLPAHAAAMEQARDASGEIAIDPGLRDVSGEIAMVRERHRSNISIETSDDDSAPVMIHESLRARAAAEAVADEPSAPILLDRKRPSEPPPVVAPASERKRASDPPPFQPLASDAAERAEEEVVELAAKKPAVVRRTERRTEIGIGIIGGRAHRDTVEGVPSQLDDDVTGEHKQQQLAAAIDRAIDIDPTKVDMWIAPPEDDASSDEIAAPPAPIHNDDTSPLASPPRPGPIPPPSGRVELSNVQRAPSIVEDDDDDVVRDIHGGKPTIVMPVMTLPADDDDGWGAPGTTIPPPFLGAIPGSMEPRNGAFPMPDVDSAPLIVAPPLPPEHRAHTNTEAGVARALEQATMRVLDLIRDLDHAQNRDEVIAVMTAHLSETHRRAGFFAVRAGELSLFSIAPNVIPLPQSAVRLDRPSTLADVVGTRLPYRGPMHDEISRAFLDAVLGMCPPEILLVPITVRERVVGVLFGEHRLRHTFDDQLALASRAAGDALERILRAKRG